MIKNKGNKKMKKLDDAFFKDVNAFLKKQALQEIQEEMNSWFNEMDKKIMENKNA